MTAFDVISPVTEESEARALGRDDLVRRLRAAETDRRQLQQQLQENKDRSGVAPLPHAPDGASASARIAELERVVGDRDARIRELEASLARANAAQRQACGGKHGHGRR